MYVGKRGLQKSFKQSQIDELLVEWCLKASAAAPPPPPPPHHPCFPQPTQPKPPAPQLRHWGLRGLLQLHYMHMSSLQARRLTLSLQCCHRCQGRCCGLPVLPQRANFAMRTWRSCEYVLASAQEKRGVVSFGKSQSRKLLSHLPCFHQLDCQAAAEWGERKSAGGRRGSRWCG